MRDKQIAFNEQRIADLQRRIEEAKQSKQVILTADVTNWRRRIVQALARLDQTTDRPAQEGVGARIGRLSRQGIIPRPIASTMRTIVEMRNAIEYEDKAMSMNENLMAWASWLVIEEWAAKEGLRI